MTRSPGSGTPIPVTKAHAYGNDFLFVPGERVTSDPATFARTLCHRHHGVGADGLILYTRRPDGATMKLWNADGSASELSGNGMRCLAALVARADRLQPGTTVTIDTTAGTKTLEFLNEDGV